MTGDGQEENNKYQGGCYLKFSGEDNIETFLGTFNLAAKAYKWSDDTKYLNLRISLKGRAAEILKDIDSEDLTFDGLVNELRKRITGQKSTRDIMNALIYIKQKRSEGIVTYNRRFRSLEKEIKKRGEEISDKGLLKFYTEGLIPEIKIQVKISKPETLQEALTNALKEEAEMEIFPQHQPEPQEETAQITALINTVTNLEERVLALTRELEKGETDNTGEGSSRDGQKYYREHQSTQVALAERGGYRKRNGGTYARGNWSQQGQTHNEHPPRRQVTSRRELGCYRCNSRSHFIRDCPEPPQVTRNHPQREAKDQARW